MYDMCVIYLHCNSADPEKLLQGNPLRDNGELKSTWLLANLVYYLRAKTAPCAVWCGSPELN